MALIDGLICYYKLDDGSGTTAVDELGSKNLTITNAWTASGKISGATNFTTSTSRGYSVATVCVYNQVRTVAGWFNSKNWAQNGAQSILIGFPIASDGSLFYEYMDWYNNQFRLSDNTNFLYANYTTTSSWVHIVGIFNNASSKLYVNGVVASSGTVNFHANTSNRYLGIGGRSTGNAIYGNMDEVGIWNRALSDEEVTTLYNSGTGLSYPFTPPASLVGPFPVFKIE